MSPIPAFSEYRRVCERLQIEFVPFPLSRGESFRAPVTRCAEHETEPCDVTLLNNPHNPSGVMLHYDEVRRLRELANDRGATLLLDEAFIDYAPQHGESAMPRPGLAWWRPILTKFYGCPALRVGYAVAHPDTIERIRSLLPTWPVAQLALDALAEAVADTEYAATSLRDNAFERKRLDGLLTSLGVNVFPSAANYLFLELRPDMPAAALRRSLIARHRILIRDCDSYEGLAMGRYIRVAVLSSEENCRLGGGTRSRAGLALSFSRPPAPNPSTFINSSNPLNFRYSAAVGCQPGGKGGERKFESPTRHPIRGVSPDNAGFYMLAGELM